MTVSLQSLDAAFGNLDNSSLPAPDPATEVQVMNAMVTYAKEFLDQTPFEPKYVTQKLSVSEYFTRLCTVRKELAPMLVKFYDTTKTRATDYHRLNIKDPIDVEVAVTSLLYGLRHTLKDLDDKIAAEIAQNVMSMTCVMYEMSGDVT